MKKMILSFLVLLLVTSCATVNRRWSTITCQEKGPSSSECSQARIAEAMENHEENQARSSNTSMGALIGCIVTGPFCLLGVGPVIGAAIGASKEVRSTYTDGMVPDGLEPPSNRPHEKTQPPTATAPVTTPPVATLSTTIPSKSACVKVHRFDNSCQ